MDRRVILMSSHGVVLLAGLVGITFVSGHWGILLALAPTAYSIVSFPHEPDNSPKTVMMSHLIALIFGSIAYIFLAQAVPLTNLEPMSEPALRIVGSALLAFVSCATIFYSLHIQQPMAYVTAFTAAIGAFSTIQAATIMLVSILFVAGLQSLRRKLEPKNNATSDGSVKNLT